MKRLFFIFIFFFSVFAFADTYKDAAGTSQMIADSFKNIWDFFYNDTPTLIEKWIAYFLIWSVKAKIYAQIELIKMSANIAKVIIDDLQIISKIMAQISILPPDVRQALVDMRLFDGLNILLHAHVTKYVMGFFR